MKKVLFLIVAMMVLASCNSGFKVGKPLVDVGGENACQFVKEQVPELREDIESVEMVEVDSLLCDTWLCFDSPKFIQASIDFYKGKLSESNYLQMISERSQLLSDVENSWMYGSVVNDSLKKLEKYNGEWRKVYKVKVTMKSGVTREPRVLMDNDGVTPRMLESEFERSLSKYHEQISRAFSDLTPY